jgi:hypothetical protein
VTVIIAFAVIVALTACGDPQQATPRPIACATWQAPDGTWMEEDNEVVDSDPCDTDDMFEVRTTAPAKPVPKPSPAKPNVRSTRR